MFTQQILLLHRARAAVVQRNCQFVHRGSKKLRCSSGTIKTRMLEQESLEVYPDKIMHVLLVLMIECMLLVVTCLCSITTGQVCHQTGTCTGKTLTVTAETVTVETSTTT